MDKLVKEQGASLILITHDLAVVSQMADRIIVMYCGKIVEKMCIRDSSSASIHSIPPAL